MMKKAGRWGLLATLSVVLLLVIIWQVFFYTEVGMAKTIGVQATRLSEHEYSSLPQSIIGDASRLAGEVVGSSQAKCQDLADQLLAAYAAARDSDIVIIFNSGGWGWNNLDKTPGWSSIIDGIQSRLAGLDFKSRVLVYHRTSKGLLGCLREMVAMAEHYPEKARELAARVDFLTDHIPNLRVIIAGESTGTVISDYTMSLLQDNERVYSVQTGTPFWHKPMALDRTLLMNSNGNTIDTFSYGRISTMIWATVKGWFGVSSPGDEPGAILNWLRAPGHDYSWQYPGVSSEVTRFLEANFGAKAGS
jgi:hypothetical protein